MIIKTSRRQFQVGLPKSIRRAANKMVRAWGELRGSHPRNPDQFFINAFGGSRKTASGVFVDEDTALKFSAVFACIRILAETMAHLPLPLYRRRADGGKEQDRDDPRFRLLHDKTNDEQNAFEFREMMEGHAALWGNAYSVIDENNAGQISALIPLDPSRTSARRDPDTKEVFYDAHPGGEMVTFPASRILHIKWMSQDGLHGITPIELFREGVGLGLSAEEFQSRFFSNDASPSGVLKHPGELTETGHDNLQRSIDKQTRGNKNAHRFLILEEGMSWDQIGIPAKDAELIGTREFQIGDVARVYRMQPHKIGLMKDATFSNIEEQNIEHVTDTILPWAVRWEQALNMKLLTEEEQRTKFWEFNLEGLLRGNSDQRSNFYKTMWEMGVFSGNDIAARENLNPFPGGDMRFVPLNFIPLESAGQLPPSSDTAPRGLLGEGESRRVRVIESTDPASILEKRSLNSRRRLQSINKRLFVDAGNRIVSREVNEVGRMISATLKTREAIGEGALLQRIADFYEGFPVTARDILLPVLLAFGEGVQAASAEEIGADAAVSPLLSAFITEYAENFGGRHSLSSRRQLRKIIADSQADEISSNLRSRLGEWGEKRAAKIASREVIQAGAAFARATYQENGIQRIRWKTIGKNCPLCNKLEGRVVGIQGSFLAKGDTVDPEDGGKTKPLITRRVVKHPQLHDGCDCMIAAAA